MPYKDQEEQNAAWRKHYDSNKEYYADRNKRRKQECKDFLKEIKEASPCTDCGKFYPHYVMDFDHLDPTTKYKSVASLISSGIKKMKEEIAKCELVCANCHRIRTHWGIV